MSWFYFKEFIKFKLISGKHKGHGIHSPSLYAYLRTCVFQKPLLFSGLVIPEYSKRASHRMISVISRSIDYFDPEELCCSPEYVSFLKEIHPDKVISSFNNNIENAARPSEFMVLNIHSLITISDALKLTGKPVKPQIFFLLNIHRTEQNKNLWNQICEMKFDIQVVDLFHFGIVINRGGIKKEHFRIRY